MADEEIHEEIQYGTDDASDSAEESHYLGEDEQAAESPAAEENTEEDSGDDDTAPPAEERQQAKPSKGVQKRIDELTRQREEANRRVDYLMGIVAQANARTAAPQQGEQQKAPEPPKPVEPPKEEDFKTYEEYLDAKAEYKVLMATAKTEREMLAKVEAIVQRDRQIREQEASSERARSWVGAGAGKFKDFSEVVLSDNVKISDDMRDILLSDPVGHEMAYYLGKNPQIAEKIFRLSPKAQAKEMGRLSAYVERSVTPQNPSKPTSAPAPIRPSGSRAVVGKDPSKMSMDEYRAYRASGGKR